MRLSAARHEYARKGAIPVSVWWAGYLVIALWAQEISGGFDFLAPGLLICLQSERWWAAAWAAALWILVQEGVGTLAFGVVIFFYAGMFVFFLLSRWLLEPENPLFIFFFSLLLAVWSWLALSGAVSFQELPTRMPAPWTYVAKQWGAYALTWGVTLFTFRRWCGHGRV